MEDPLCTSLHSILLCSDLTDPATSILTPDIYFFSLSRAAMLCQMLEVTLQSSLPQNLPLYIVSLQHLSQVILVLVMFRVYIHPVLVYNQE